MDERAEELLGPEHPRDPAEARALERKLEEEDFQIRVKLGGYATALVLGALFLLAPMLAGLGGHVLARSWPALSWPIFLWTIVNLPLLTLAALTLRRGKLPLGRGRFLTGARARRAALGMIAVSLFMFFGRGVLQAIWEWMTQAGW